MSVGSREAKRAILKKLIQSPLGFTSLQTSRSLDYRSSCLLISLNVVKSLAQLGSCTSGESRCKITTYNYRALYKGIMAESWVASGE